MVHVKGKGGGGNKYCDGQNQCDRSQVRSTVMLHGWMWMGERERERERESGPFSFLAVLAWCVPHCLPGSFAVGEVKLWLLGLIFGAEVEVGWSRLLPVREGSSEQREKPESAREERKTGASVS